VTADSLRAVAGHQPDDQGPDHGDDDGQHAESVVCRDGVRKRQLLEVEQVGEEVDQPQQNEGDHRADGPDDEGQKRDPQQPGAGGEIAFREKLASVGGTAILCHYPTPCSIAGPSRL
jgi:hypothetical protein